MFDSLQPQGLRSAEFSKTGLTGRKYRQEFLQQRFQRLSDAEQALLLAHMQSIHKAVEPENGAGKEALSASLKATVRIYKNRSAKWRTETFGRLLSVDPQSLDRAAILFLRQHRRYFPALLVALNAAYRGEDIGLLTARGNRRGHARMIRVIEDFLGFEIPRRNIYFVNDDSRNKRLGGVPTAEKKLQILRDFASGSYVDEKGERRPLSRRYRRVYFYDDEEKNVRTVNMYAMANGLTGRIVALDSNQLSEAALWKKLMRKAERGLKPQVGRRSVIHFFDIDGTLIKVNARMYVVDKTTGTRLLTITQADLAEHPTVPYWLEKAHKICPQIPLESLEMDFADFRDPERVGQLIEEVRHSNRVFKRKRSA